MTRSRRKKTKPQKESQLPAIAIDGPSRLRPTHVRDVTLSIVAGAPKGVRNVDWPIEIAFEAGRLGKGEERWLAIRDYATLIDTSEIRSGKDSTSLDIVSGGGNYPVSQARADAIKKLVSIDSLLPQKDRTIARKLCEGHSLPGAVRAACGDSFVYAVTARVNDALDALGQAMRGAKRSNYKFDLRTL